MSRARENADGARLDAPLESPEFTGTPTGITAAHLEAGVLPSDVTGGSGLALSGPVGMIASFGMATAPTGWIICNGTAVSRTVTYDVLFGTIGTTWGVGDGSGTFNLPDLRGGFLRGVGASAGFTVNHTTVLATKESDTQQGHYHYTRVKDAVYYPYRNAGNFTAGSTAGVAYADAAKYSTSVIAREYLTSAEGGPNGDVRSGDENRPNNIGVTFCIKY